MLRNNFPKYPISGLMNYGDGRIDNFHFFIDFWAENMDDVVASVREFLDKEGYSDVPLPTGERLLWDYLIPNDNGDFSSFIWHPITIEQSHYSTNAVRLTIYNEQHERHVESWKILCSEG